MRSILEYIAEALADWRSVFVFPAGAPAKFWAEATAEALLEPVTELRFRGWDFFKAQTLSVNPPDKKPINRAIRTLFASSLLRENAQKGKTFLAEYINPVYAGAYSSFIGSLARLLPRLEDVLRRSASAGAQGEPYFADLRQIQERYRRFLDAHLLYEPAWNRGAFRASETRWVLFFPELTEDWEEYREELTGLAAAGGLRIIPLGAVRPPAYREQGASAETIREILSGECIGFSFAGDEYRWIALTIRRLFAEGRLCPRDIVISGNADTERLIQTLKRYDIQADMREGRQVTEYPGGRIFGALSACSAEKWSYRSLKNLLLDKAFPWKDTARIDGLMEFGLRYRCVSGFSGVDVWERTFEWQKDRPPKPGELPVADIHRFYKDLKEKILAILTASTFEDIKKGWFAFKTAFFEEAGFHSEVDKVIGQSIGYLDELAEIEQQFPGLFPQGDRAFPVFQSYLQEQKYVYQTGRGIAVYDYKVAAGIGPAVHFVINMNQASAAVVYEGAGFLREDRKRGLGIQDQDVSGEFIKAYRFSASFPVFTVSAKTFQGPAVPHRRLLELFGEPLSLQRFPPDPYRIEAALARGAGSAETAAPAAFQVQGRRKLRVLREPPAGTDLRRHRIATSSLAEALAERLVRQASFRQGAESQAGQDYIAPTDLNEYLLCPFKWLLERALFVKEKQTAIETIDQRDLGMLYHRILECFFKRLKDEQRRFRKDEMSRYETYIIEETQNALARARAREGAFQESIYAMLEQRISTALIDYLSADASALNGAGVLGTEFALWKRYGPEKPCLIGKADAVLSYEDGGFILTDFKTGNTPAKKDLFAGDREYPDNLQMAAYIDMLETGMNPQNAETLPPQAGTPPTQADAPPTQAGAPPQKVETARFYSIDNREFRPVVSEREENERKQLLRKDYDAEVASVETVVSLIADAMKQGAYTVPKNPERKKCTACAVSSVCRTPFIGGEIDAS